MESEQQTQQAVQASDILGDLGTLGHGAFIVECGRQYQKLINAIQATTKKGKITISLELAPGVLNMGRVTQMDITPTVKIDEPQPSHGVNVFFVGENNRLSTNDTEQLDMFRRGE